MRMAAVLDSNSSDDEDFEGFVVSPEEKASYKVWSRKRRVSEAFDDSSDNEENLSGDGDEDDEDEDDDDSDDDDDYESAKEEEEEHEDEENDELDDALDDIQLQDSVDETSPSHTDQCPVCLMSLKEQLLGTPNNCPHVFCFDCIQEWAKNATTCPVGRKPFTEILVHATRKGPVLQRIPVEERKAEEDELEEDPTFCEVCGETDREDRMLLCDGCDHGYHMECLTPPVEYVPVEEWYCPGCSTQPESHEDPEELPEEEHMEEGLREVPRPRATRGRPRGSTSRRVSVSGRTDTTRRARTVASARGRGRTVRGRGRGRGRGRSSTRGRGRGGRGSSTRGRSKTKTSTGRRKKRRKKRSQSKKKTRTKRRKTSSKTKTLKPIKRRRIAEEDEVSPFIYEPKRRGRTVHARLLESLNSPGTSAEPGRSASLGRVPFPSRLEPSSSFSLFGNAYALHDFADQEDDTRETSHVEEKATAAWSSESNNPDVLGSIFQGLHSLHSPSAQLSRDGKILTAADEIKQRTAEEGKRLKEIDKSSNEPDIAKHSTKDKRYSDEECSRGNIFEKLSSSKTADTHAGSCTKPSNTERPAKTSRSPSSSFKSVSSSPLALASSKSTFSSFRIPKRSSKSQDEPNQTSPSFGSSIHVKQEQNPTSSISNFKIPKRTNSVSSDDSSKSESSNSGIAKPANVNCIGQKLATSSTSGVGQKVTLSHFTSLRKGVTHSGCVTESKTAGSSLTYSNRVRPVMQENLQWKHLSNSSTVATEGSVTNTSNVVRSHAKAINSTTTISCTSVSTTCLPPAAAAAAAAAAGPRVTNSSSVTKCHAKNVSSVTQSHTTATNNTVQGVTNSNRATACHATNVSNVPRSPTKTSNSPSPLTKVAPLIDNLKPAGGKEQRRSNIEILKMLHEKQKSMREQMSGDGKGPSSSRPRNSGVTDTSVLPRKQIHVSDKSPTCSREVTLPVAIVKPSRQVPSVTVKSPSSLPCSSLENSPVKSIASGIINAHSCNTQEFKRVRSESDPSKSVGLKRSGSHVGHDATKRKHDGTVTGVNGDREQQRKLGIARLQRREQIVDEVKLALKPFFKHGEITKDDYKLIMRKSVEKIKESSSSVDRDRVCRLVKKYIKKIKGDNFSWSP